MIPENFSQRTHVFAGMCLEVGFLLKILKRLSAPLSVSNLENTEPFPFLCKNESAKVNTKNKIR